MPKLTWQTAPRPETPLQRSAFLDLCVDWLVRGEAPRQHEGDPPFETRTTCTPPPPFVTPERALGITSADLRTRGERVCAFCEDRSRSARPVLANPFAQKPWALVCEACMGGTPRPPAK